MSIKIEMLRTFRTVAQTGNLAEAAIRLGRTASAVSMTLKQLEEHLGQRLFESERKNRLTPLGEEVFGLAEEQLRQFDMTISAIETSARSPHGLIRVASVPSVACLVFPHAVRTLSAQHPGLKVELRDMDSEQVIRALLQGQSDLGVVSGQHMLNGLRCEPLFQDRFGLISAPGHPLARHEGPVTLDALQGSFISNNLCAMIETPEFQSVLSDTKVSAPNTLSLIAMVRSGAWVTVLPETVTHILPGELAFRPIKGLEDRRQVTLLLRERSTALTVAEDLVRIVGETVRRKDLATA